MRCEDARSVLWPEPASRSASDEISRRALDHYATCESCQRFFRAQRALAARVARLKDSVTVPGGRAARTRAALADETVLGAASRRSYRWIAWGSPAVIAAAAALVLLLRPADVPSAVAQPLVQQAQVIAYQEDGYTSSSIPDLEAWLESRVGYPVHVPDISNAYLVGARVARLSDTETAAVVYLVHGLPLTYFALPSDRVMGREIRGGRVLAVSADGYEVALWAEQDGARAIVAAMPRNHVVDVAKECRDKRARQAS
jgi:hypothetical protein